MANRKHQHVTRRDDGSWQRKREGASKAGSVHETQAEAEAVAKETARREGGEVIIHGRDGKIRDKDSFGNDPNPLKDTKH
jgi:hypothetical protein